MKEKKGADPKMIVAVQMLSIGIILVCLGTLVFFLSPIGRMDPFVRICSIASNSSITLLGLFFIIGGFFRYKKAKNEN